MENATYGKNGDGGVGRSKEGRHVVESGNEEVDRARMVEGERIGDLGRVGIAGPNAVESANKHDEAKSEHDRTVLMNQV